ncbi:MAG: hypothetical protein U0L04_10160 [Bacteroidaceae bacterium]|nr:hypothetical protein [Bacteroidaceae bacterium]
MSVHPVSWVADDSNHGYQNYRQSNGIDSVEKNPASVSVRYQPVHQRSEHNRGSRQQQHSQPHDILQSVGEVFITSVQHHYSTYDSTQK